MKLVVLVPTFNERENIRHLVERLLQLSVHCHVLVVDDGSPVGTGEIVEDLARQDDRVHLIQRGLKMGLGTAYLAGFQHALNAGAQFVVTMDADFSHCPETVPLLFAGCEASHLCVGTRYIPGGSVLNWPRRRVLLSRSANCFARTLLALPFHDVTSGFRCYSRRTIQAVRDANIRSSGYSFLIEAAFVCHRLKLLVREVPISFTDRTRGASKISKAEIFNAFRTVTRLFCSRIVCSKALRTASRNPSDESQ